MNGGPIPESQVFYANPDPPEVFIPFNPTDEAQRVGWLRADALAIPEEPKANAWRIYGRATIDDRPAVSCTLTVNPDGTWAAEIATFTLAGQVDLMMEAREGGHFCGPAFVGYSRADSAPFKMRTELIGCGPLLVVDPSTVQGALPDAKMVDAEVVE